MRWTPSWFPATLTCLTSHYSKLIRPQQVSYLSVCFAKTSSTQVPLNLVQVGVPWAAEWRVVSLLRNLNYSQKSNYNKIVQAFHCLSWWMLAKKNDELLLPTDAFVSETHTRSTLEDTAHTWKSNCACRRNAKKRLALPYTLMLCSAESWVTPICLWWVADS